MNQPTGKSQPPKKSRGTGYARISKEEEELRLRCFGLFLESHTTDSIASIVGIPIKRVYRYRKIDGWLQKTKNGLQQRLRDKQKTFDEQARKTEVPSGAEAGTIIELGRSRKGVWLEMPTLVVPIGVRSYGVDPTNPRVTVSEPEIVRDEDGKEIGVAYKRKYFVYT